MTKRDRTVVAVLVAAAILGGFWFLFVGPKRQTSAELDKKIAVQQTRLTVAQGQAAAAVVAKRRYETDYAAVAKLGQAVPADDDVPSLVYQVAQASKASKIDFRSLEVTEGSAATKAPPAPAPAAPAAAAPATGTTSAPATQAAVAGQPAGTTVGAAQFPTMPFAFVFDGSFFDMERFMRRLSGFTTIKKHGVVVRGRLLTVDSFQLGAGDKGFPAVTASINATAYVLPEGQGLTAGATAKGPAIISADPAAGGSGSSTPTAPATAALTSGGSR